MGQICGGTDLQETPKGKPTKGEMISTTSNNTNDSNDTDNNNSKNNNKNNNDKSQGKQVTPNMSSKEPLRDNSNNMSDVDIDNVNDPIIGETTNNNVENNNNTNDTNDENTDDVDIEIETPYDPNLPKLIGIKLERFKIYESNIIKFLGGESAGIKLISIKAELPDNIEEKDEIVEKIIAIYKNNESNGKEIEKEIQATCDISMDDEFSPSQLLEFTFDNKNWYLANVYPEYLEYYKDSKFENWKKMMEEPDCEASFKRLLKRGVITNMFDDSLFPSPPDEQALYQVKDHRGKTVTIPRPVTAMRVWNPSKQEYESIDPHLTGAPRTKEETDKFWNEMLEKFYLQHGRVTVESWINETAGGPDDF